MEKKKPLTRKELLEKVAAQGEVLKKTGANLQQEIRQSLAQLAERAPEIGEDYSAIGSPFVSAHFDRQFEQPYNGMVFVWDIDKTYLQTHFSSLRGLAAIPFEGAEDKIAIPGTIPILKALKKGMHSWRDLAHPLFFVSGSPPQLRQVIQEKMTLDGIRYDGLMFKDQWGLVRAGRPKDVKKQIGYKLAALLTLKLHIPGNPSFYCFGDDVESDAEVFELYAEVMKGMSQQALLERLNDAEVHEHDMDYIFSVINEESMQESVKGYANKEPVEKVFINLEKRTAPTHFNNSLVKPGYNFLQIVFVLVNMGLVPETCIRVVADELRESGMAELALAAYALEAVERFALPMIYAEQVFRNPVDK